jgi:hypothetical protein
VKFLISVIDTATNSGSGDEIAVIDAFNDNRNGAGITIDGRLHEPTTNADNEYVSGFWLIEAVDIAAARELASRGSRACNRKVELRPLLGA